MRLSTSPIHLLEHTPMSEIILKIVIKLIALSLPASDIFLAALAYPCALVLRTIRTFGISKLPTCKKILLMVGVFPINDHYYEPQFNFEKSTKLFSTPRLLPAIHWNVDEQLNHLAILSYADEILKLPIEKTDSLEFYMNNRKF